MTVYLIFFSLSAVLTYVIKKYAISKSIIDIPNERSSHSIPTPRGGGLAIIVVFYIGLLYFRETIKIEVFYALLSAFPVAAMGLLDDIFGLRASVRFIVQVLSASVAMWFLHGVASIDLIWFSLDGWWLNIFGLFFIVWMTNLYNFLDGIDGYAASQAVVAGLGMVLLFDMPMGGIIAAANLGFLLFNWQKASIFMGDVGSATQGFIFAVLILADTGKGDFYVWLVILSLFWYDATVTLIRRYKNKEKIFTAHRKHAYQRLVQSGWSHQKVVLSAIVFNLFFLFLLYVWEAPVMVFFLDLAMLYGIMVMIDHKKAFV